MHLMLVSAVVSPHPPVIIPEVGGKAREKTKKTIRALKSLNKRLRSLRPETLVVITPHGLIYPDRFNVCGMPFLEGDLKRFGVEVQKRYQNDLEIVYRLDKLAQEENIPVLPYDNGEEVFELDHGVFVPLYYLAAGLKVKVVPITYSYLSVAMHYSFGQILGRVITESSKRIAVIASGDLSHRLKYSQYGYSAEGQIFDKNIRKFLSRGDSKGILSLDEGLVEKAGECGYRSLAILLGVLDQRQWRARILSYEAPFGIGYLVADIKFN